MSNTAKSIRVKLYPTVKQKQVLDQHFNAYRYCYNLCLEYKSLMWDEYRINKSGYEMQSELFEIRKQTPWLNKCKAECVRDAALNVEKTFKVFFNKGGYPKFKSKNNKQSFSAYQSLHAINKCIKFYGVFIKFKTSGTFSDLLSASKIKKVTFSKDRCGEYFASCLIEFNPEQLTTSDKTIGVDLGIKDLAITSDSDVYPNNNYLISSKYKLRRLQRRFSKSKKGGANRNKLRIKIAKVHRKAVRQKEYTYHQVTNKLIRDNQTIVLETLRVKNMMGNHKLARNISDASWSTFTAMLEYKAKWYARDVIRIGTFYPSSKTCSGCGNVRDTLLLSERVYQCAECGLTIDRDINASINIKNAGMKIPAVPTEDTGNSQADEVGSNSLSANTFLSNTEILN